MVPSSACCTDPNTCTCCLSITSPACTPCIFPLRSYSHNLPDKGGWHALVGMCITDASTFSIVLKGKQRSEQWGSEAHTPTSRPPGLHQLHCGWPKLSHETPHMHAQLIMCDGPTATEQHRQHGHSPASQPERSGVRTCRTASAALRLPASRVCTSALHWKPG